MRRLSPDNNNTAAGYRIKTSRSKPTIMQTIGAMRIISQWPLRVALLYDQKWLLPYEFLDCTFYKRI